ncbi:MAG: ABC transporter substrate-binding protein [Thermoleophilia bacterium]|nr:ABC transporter substrate-binding protein [Thermoleophilia bacterium]
MEKQTGGGDRYDALVERITRRNFIKIAGAAGLVAGLAPVLAACGGGEEAAPETTAPATETVATTTPATTGGGATGRPLKIGYVTPQTGALAGFGEADTFVLAEMEKRFADGLDVGGTTHPVEIVARDSESDPNRAAEVAGSLVLDDGVDLVLVEGTPETTNPVSDTCEANGVPCISSVAPWQPWFFGRNGDPAAGFQWTYHFFWGLEDIIAVFLSMWSQVETNKMVGAIWPNDGDGNAWGDPELGFPKPLTEAGYTITDPGRYPNLTDDFSAQISEFKSKGVEIVTGVPIPPDWTTFWTQAAQQGFKPKIASIGKALLFPASVEALGELGDGMSTEVWWSPTHPFTSSLTGQSAGDLAAAYTTATQRQWTQPIGFAHALFEVGADALSRSADVDDKAAIAAAIAATSLDTVVGNITWEGGPVPNVAKTKLVGGQWSPGTDFPYDLVIVENAALPDVPTGGTLRPIPGS